MMHVGGIKKEIRDQKENCSVKNDEERGSDTYNIMVLPLHNTDECLGDKTIT